MSEENVDANVAEATSNESSEFENALNEGMESGEATPSKEPEPSAETLNTGDEGDKVPWHEDKRWKEWQEEKKAFEENKENLSKQAQTAEYWNSALKNPQFAKKVLGVIEELTSGEGEAPVEEAPSDLDKVAEKLLNTKAFKGVLGKFDQIDKTLGSTTEEMVASRFDKVIGSYQKDFNTMMKDVEVDAEYQGTFERQVWDNLYKESPDSVNNLEYNPQAFNKALESAKESYNKLTNSITSKFTNKALKEGSPQTGGSQTVPLQSGQSEEEALDDFVSQLSSLNN